MLGLRFCARAFSSCGKRGPLFIAVRGPLTIAASLVAEHGLQTRRLSNCGSRAQLLRGMWDLPRPGLEPVSPALAGRFSTTAPRGKPLMWTIFKVFTEFVTTLLLFYVLVFWPWGMWDLSSLTRDQRGPQKVKCQPLDLQGSPSTQSLPSALVSSPWQDMVLEALSNVNVFISKCIVWYLLTCVGHLNQEEIIYAS